MKLGKGLAISAAAGMLAGVLAGCAQQQQPPATDPSSAAPSTDVAAPADKNCCKGKNECKGTSGCKTEDNASCAGQNECKGKGTSCPKPS